MIMPGSVKICSLRRPEHAEMVVASGADMFGLIFVEHAWRKITPADAQVIVEEVRHLSPNRLIRSVGVFVGTSSNEINRIADQVGLDIVQVNAADLPSDLTQIERPTIAVVRPEKGTPPESVLSQMHELSARKGGLEGILIDAFSPSGNGGLGELSDWELGTHVANKLPIVLAGGLTPENVSRAIAEVQPIGVDVSTGVETDTEKDRDKILAFVRNARRAFAAESIGQVDFVPRR